jgi:5S rRNA maturation endonuclease (ribonuclease M5)
MEILKLKSIIDRILGDPIKSSKEYLYYCKFCKFEKKPKFSISYEKSKWKCWVCEWQGSDLSVLIKKFGTKDDVKEYFAFSNTSSLESIQSILFPKKKEKEVHNTCEIPSEYKFLFYSDSKIAKQAWCYLSKERGLTVEDVYRHRIGICEKGDYAYRFIIPSFNSEGDCNFYIAQGFLKDTKYKWLYPDVPKSQIIFDEINIDWSKPVVLCEGFFDKTKLQTVTNNVIPLNGKTISTDEYGYSYLIEMLILYKPEIYVALDTDIVKGEKINRSLNVVKFLMNYDLKCSIIDPGNKKDFGNIKKDNILEYFNKKEKIDSKFDLLKKQLELISI